MIKITLAVLLGIYSIDCAQADIFTSLGTALNAAGAATSSIERSVSGAVKTVSGAVKTVSTGTVEFSAAHLHRELSDMQMTLQTQLEVANASAKTHVANALMQANHSYTNALNHLEKLEAQLQQVNMSNSPKGKANIQRLAAYIHNIIAGAEKHVNTAAISIVTHKAHIIQHTANTLNKAAIGLVDTTLLDNS